MVHDFHDLFLVPPTRILNALDFASHDNYLAGRDELTASVSRAQMRRYSRWCHITVERLSDTVDKFRPLSGGPRIWWAGRQDKVAVQVNNQRIRRRSEQCPTLGSHTEDIWAGLLDEFSRMASVYDRHVQSTPLIDAYEVAHAFGGDGEHRRVVGDEDYPACRRHRGLQYPDNVRDGQTGEKRPHGKVLETRWRGWELIAQSIVLHVNSNKIIETRSREAQNPRNFLGVEEVGRLVPVNPHAAKVITEKVVKRVS